MADDDWKGEHLIRRNPAHDERSTTDSTLPARWAMRMKRLKAAAAPEAGPKKRGKAREAKA